MVKATGWSSKLSGLHKTKLKLWTPTLPLTTLTPNYPGELTQDRSHNPGFL